MMMVGTGAFEFEDVVTPAAGTWANQLFNRTGMYIFISVSVYSFLYIYLYVC
jgi:hypothetical protein